MEDILASIKKYVATDEAAASRQKQPAPVEPDDIIQLSKGDVVEEEKEPSFDDIPVYSATYEEEEVYREPGSVSSSEDYALHNFTEQHKPQTTLPQERATSPFAKLTDALKSYGATSEKKDKAGSKKQTSRTVDELFGEIAERIVQEWVDKNLERIVADIVNAEIEKIKNVGQ